MAIARKKKRKPGAILVTLPEKKNVPSEFLTDYILLIYGVKKIGKTSLCQYFENPFFMMLEPGAKALSVYQTCDANGNPKTIQTWQEFKAWVNVLKKDKRFKFIVVDTVDRAYKLCQKYVCNKLGIEHPSDLSWGKGYEAVREEFESVVLDQLLAFGKGVAFISHAKEAEIKTRVGDVYHKITSTMANSGKECIEGVIDLWCHYKFDGTKRTLVIEGNEDTDSGSRLEKWFKYTNGNKVKEIPMGNTAKEGYENLISAFYNELEEPKPQIKKIKRKLKLKRRK